MINYLRFHVPYWWHTLKEEASIKVAWLLPRRVAYWAAIRVTSMATTGSYAHETPVDLKVMTALQRWEKQGAFK